MADNFNFTPGTGGVGAADDVGGVLYQRVKLDAGGDGAATPVLAGGGVEASALRVTLASDSTGQVKLAAGTAAIGKLTANTGVDIGDVDVTSMPTGASATQVQGTVATGSAAANNPVLTGGRATATLPTTVDADDATPLSTDLRGRLLTTEVDSSQIFTGITATITDTTVTQVLTNAGASAKWRIFAIGVYNSDATVGTWVKIQDDTETPLVYWRGYCAPAGGGFNINFSPPLAAFGKTDGKINVVAETTSAEIGCSVCAFLTPVT